LAEFCDEIAELLAPFYPRESIKLYQFPEKDSESIRFLVRHGGPLVREGIVKADAPGESDSTLFRREVFDVIVYDPENDEVRVSGKKRDAELYTRACGVHFVANEDAFPDTDKYTLDPLIKKGEQALACAHVFGLKKITLIGLDVALEALRETWRARRATMKDLEHYARIDRVAKVMRPYLESLT
jgi:hypothetical protein